MPGIGNIHVCTIRLRDSLLQDLDMHNSFLMFHFRLEGLDPNAYNAFQASRDLKDVVERVQKLREESGSKPGLSKKLSVRASLMTPVLPMLVNDML